MGKLKERRETTRGYVVCRTVLNNSSFLTHTVHCIDICYRKSCLAACSSLTREGRSAYVNSKGYIFFCFSSFVDSTGTAAAE